MNRWDRIRAEALTAADLLTPDAETREKVADSLIRLVGQMVAAVGKAVAVEGEGDVNDTLDWTYETDGNMSPENEANALASFEREQRAAVKSAHTRYRVGEEIQTGAVEAVSEALAANLGRYEASGLPPVWKPSREHTAPTTGPSQADIVVKMFKDQVETQSEVATRLLGVLLGQVSPTAAPGCPECGRQQDHALDCSRGFGGFKGMPREYVKASASEPRSCCYGDPCPMCRGGNSPVRCCYPIRDVCPQHC